MREYDVEVHVRGETVFSVSLFDQRNALKIAKADPADVTVRVYQVDESRRLIGVAAGELDHLPSPPDEDEHVNGWPT